MRNYIPVNVNDLPDIFDINLAGTIYTFRIDYNAVTDYYTCTIQSPEATLLDQEPLLLGQLVGIDLPDKRLPRVDLRVMDEFGTGNVQIYLDVVDPNGSETEDPTIEPLGYDPDETTDDLTDSEVDI